MVSAEAALRRVHWPTEKPLKDVTFAAIAVGKGIEGILHTGVLFTDMRGSEQVMMLHLRMHHKLTCEEPYLDYCWVELNLPPERLRLIARLCRAIEKRYPDGKLAYAVRYTGGSFSAGGELLSGDGKGLTCATFVLAVFASQGWRLVDHANWPARPEDRAAHKQLLELMRKEGAEVEQLAAVQNEMGCARFRAEEVAAAATSEVLPATFEYAARVGGLIRSKVSGTALA